METLEQYAIVVSARTYYLQKQSDAARNYFVFAYSIGITNHGSVGAKLLSRHWFIVDANGRTQEVQGEGVIGQQPYLLPGEKFQYRSYAVIETPVGSMYGKYQMMADDGHLFEAIIPAFSLAIPRLLH